MDFQKILKELGSFGIHLDLDWIWDDYGNLQKEFRDEYHIELSNHTIICNVFAHEIIQIIPGNYYQPENVHSTGLNLKIEDIELYDENGEIELTKSQTEKIRKQITRNILL